MQREEMERIFCWKIGAELKGFQYCMMQKSKEEIFASAYQIDCMVRIYELLAEISQKMEVDQMQKCMEISSLLSWKSAQSNRLDEKRLKEEEPEIYEKYKKSVSSRRFTVKAA